MKLAPHALDLLRTISVDELDNELTRRSLKSFIRGAWPLVEPGAPFIDSWHLDAISEHLEALARGDIKRLIINMPPRHGKSILASVMFPAWLWLTDPSRKMVTCSYQLRLAVRDSIRSRALLNTPWFRKLNCIDSEPIFRLKDSKHDDSAALKDVEYWYQNSKGGQRFAVGVDGGATGEGGSLLTVDDPHNPKQAHSEAERIHALEWWDRTMSTRLDNLATGLKMIIMQRLHVFDLSGHELSQNLGYTLLKLRGDFDSRQRCITVLGDKTWQDPREVDGSILCPERFPEDEVKKLKVSLGSYGTAGQWNQEPIPEGGGVFKRAWFKSWSVLPVFDSVVISVDCAFTNADDSSFVVLQSWGFKGPQAYLLDQIREHLSFTETEQAIRVLRKKEDALHRNVSAVLIENKANGPAIINRLSTEMTGIIPIEPKGGKESRAQAVSPMVEAGNVLLPENPAWLSDFFVEVTNFPKYSSDDQVDAMSQALSWRYLRDDQVERMSAGERFNRWAGV